MTLADLILPPGSFDLPKRDPIADAIADSLRPHIVIPEPVDVALAWDAAGNFDEVPLPDPDDDDALDAFGDAGGVIITAADQFVPDVDDLARWALEVAGRAGPPHWSPRRWTSLERLFRAGSWLGMGPSWGFTTWDLRGNRYNGGKLRWSWPVYRSRWTCDGEPRTTWKLRSTILGRPDWWWECHRRQGLKIVGRHQPERPWAFGICAACVPCQTCGAHRDCLPTCPEVTGR